MSDTLYFRALACLYPSPDELVRDVADGWDSDLRAALADLLDQIGRSGQLIGHIKGVKRLGSELPCVAVLLPDGAAAFGQVFIDEAPCSRADMLDLCEREAGECEPGFTFLVFPAGVVREALQ